MNIDFVFAEYIFGDMKQAMLMQGPPLVSYQQQGRIANEIRIIFSEIIDQNKNILKRCIWTIQQKIFQNEKHFQ